MLPTSKQWKKWSLPSKLTAIGTYVGIIGIVITLALYIVDKTKPSAHVTFDVFPADTTSAKDDPPLLTRTFWILKEKGASITLGPCPGPKCLKFELAEVETIEDTLVQKIAISGEGLKDVLQLAALPESWAEKTNQDNLPGVVSNAAPVLLAGKGAYITVRSGPDAERVVTTSGTNLLLGIGNRARTNFVESMGIPLLPNAFVQIHSRAALIRLTVLDTRINSLKIRLDIRPPQPLSL